MSERATYEVAVFPAASRFKTYRRFI